jgi:hypothetical protein
MLTQLGDLKDLELNQCAPPPFEAHRHPLSAAPGSPGASHTCLPLLPADRCAPSHTRRWLASRTCAHRLCSGR